ncbi:MAG: M48 family metallopeptidase [Planctomycetota bacterium]|jgi:STE24 endopeptidase
MHLLTILAFAAVLWQAEETGQWLMVPKNDLWITLSAAAGMPLFITLASWMVSQRGLHLIRRGPSGLDEAHVFHQRVMFGLRIVALAWSSSLVFFTRWPAFFAWGRIQPAIQFLGDLVVLSPYMISFVLMWIVTFPLEKALREGDSPIPDPVDVAAGTHTWRFTTFMDFHLRHYLLVVAIPMTVILFAAGIANGYENQLMAATRLPFASDILVGTVATIMFITAPMMLRYIWQTEPLANGPLRERLESLCGRINLRCRDILVWKSDGMMINAAVMGLVPRVRYVMLSDALLETMSDDQVEAVFGHEAGHICRRHIQLFLVFAFGGWLITAGIMESMAQLALRMGWQSEQTAMLVQAGGVLVTVLIWGIGFGMLSRRFERQADLFGARCVASHLKACPEPCSVHRDDLAGADSVDRVCSTGASIFSSALDRVAILNGIPHEEWSWRHSSIGSRIRFLSSAASDPALAIRFESRLRRIRNFLIAGSAIGTCLGLLYWQSVSIPAILRLQQAGEKKATVVFVDLEATCC